ncbi:MAG: RES family NAD+ phosphorylase [Gaiellaceae bacterium]
MILFRCLPWNEAVEADARGGALWFPRLLQGEGRHDAPERYGCLYVSAEPVAAVVEQLARLAGTVLGPRDLIREGLPLTLAALSLPETAPLVDLDEPFVLAEEGLRPSRVATGDRALTQADAGALHERHPEAAGLRWWSIHESQWANVTLFDRAAPELRVDDVKPLELGDDVVGEAAAFLGLGLAA